MEAHPFDALDHQPVVAIGKLRQLDNPCHDSGGIHVGRAWRVHVAAGTGEDKRVGLVVDEPLDELSRAALPHEDRRHCLRQHHAVSKGKYR